MYRVPGGKQLLNDGLFGQQPERVSGERDAVLRREWLLAIVRLHQHSVVRSLPAGADETNVAVPDRGSQIIRLASGDGATVIAEACACGFTAPRVRDVHRLVSPTERAAEPRHAPNAE